MLDFDISEKSLGQVSPPHFMYDFLRKMFILLHSINWPNFSVCSRDIGQYELLQYFVNQAWDIGQYDLLQFFVNVIKFEINPIFLIKSFWYTTKKSGQNNEPRLNWDLTMNQDFKLG